MASLFELKPLVRGGVENTDCTFKSERHFLDLVIDGQSLWEAEEKKREQVSIFCAEYSAEETAKAVRRLRWHEKAYLPNGRCSLFVCSECGDLGCGTVTAPAFQKPESCSGIARKHRWRKI